MSLVVAAGLMVAKPGSAQPDSTRPRPRPGADGAVPLASLIVPGFGQYFYGDPAAGLLFTGTAVAGYGLGSDRVDGFNDGLPRTTKSQLRAVAVQAAFVAGGLSAYDAFRRGLPALQRDGKYRFLARHEPTRTLLTAPFDPSFLKRWTTWVNLGYTALVTVVVVVADTRPRGQYLPFKANDAGFAAAISAGAALSEEALFRGWIYPYLQQRMPGTFLPNALQAGAFSALHIPNNPGAFLAAIAGWAFYEGWVTRRNGWSVRESVFHHFWYDAAVFTASLATETGAGRISFSIPFTMRGHP